MRFLELVLLCREREAPTINGIAVVVLMRPVVQVLRIAAAANVTRMQHEEAVRHGPVPRGRHDAMRSVGTTLVSDSAVALRANAPLP